MKTIKERFAGWFSYCFIMAIVKPMTWFYKLVAWALGAAIFIGCNAASSSNDCNGAPVVKTTACILYDKNVAGQTMQRATFDVALVGGTTWEQTQYLNAANQYDSFWSCNAYSKASSTAWCECPRGDNKTFEDAREKDSNVKWIGSK